MDHHHPPTLNKYQYQHYNQTKIPHIYPQHTELISLDLEVPNLSGDETRPLKKITAPSNSGPEGHKSVLLLDDQEQLLIQTVEEFLQILRIDVTHKVKVVAIFGNSGEGKSYTLNNTFFEGAEVFHTSTSQRSCTLGVWAMYNPKLKVLCLDTEGLLGISKKELQRTRLLLKILAVSDIIVYRTKADRLQRHMFSFLGGASKAYKDHFSAALTQALKEHGVDRPVTSLGPAVIIFHETRFTDTLESCATVELSVEDIIEENFRELGQNYDSFSSIKYIGVKNNDGPTSFVELRNALQRELESTEVRSARDPKYIYLTLKGLNSKFRTAITSPMPELYLSEFFTCQEKCLSCHGSCILSIGHLEENEHHQCKTKCSLQHQFQNYVYLCKRCHKNGKSQIVDQKSHQHNQNNRDGNEWSLSALMTSVWVGETIECPKCGVIYRSREYWYGNQSPEETGAVIVDIVHVWSEEKSLFDSQNFAQKALDWGSSITSAVGSVTAVPKKVVKEWVTSKIAPSYWRPDDEILECYACNASFEPDISKHHCRSCGEGFCNECTQHTSLVPLRGYHTTLERVCNNCYQKLEQQTEELLQKYKSFSTPISSIGSNSSITNLQNKTSPPNCSPNEASSPSNSQITETSTTLPSNESLENDLRARRLAESALTSLNVVKKTVFGGPASLIKDYARPTYWVPDAECLVCAVCRKSFSDTPKTTISSRGECLVRLGVLRSLHHCRDCGRGVCDECSPFRKPVPYRGWHTPTRVCKDCHLG